MNKKGYVIESDITPGQFFTPGRTPSLGPFKDARVFTQERYAKISPLSKRGKIREVTVILGGEDLVTIPRKRFESLLEDETWRECVEGAGVDNWSGMDLAYELMEAAEGGEED